MARVGLVKAVNRYDPERGSFTAYAISTITGEIKRHFRNHTWAVHVPRRWQDHRLKLELICRPDVVGVGVSGEIDRDNAGYLRDELLTTVRCCGRTQKLIIELSGVPLLDAAGIGVLLAVHEAARVRGVTVRVVGLQPYVARIVALSGLRDLLGEFETRTGEPGNRS